jgi:hypothetical protein
MQFLHFVFLKDSLVINFFTLNLIFIKFINIIRPTIHLIINLFVIIIILKLLYLLFLTIRFNFSIRFCLLGEFLFNFINFLFLFHNFLYLFPNFIFKILVFLICFYFLCIFPFFTFKFIKIITNYYLVSKYLKFQLIFD